MQLATDSTRLTDTLSIEDVGFFVLLFCFVFRKDLGKKVEINFLVETGMVLAKWILRCEIWAFFSLSLLN